MKYSMVTINRKLEDNGILRIRRVLIQYESSEANEPTDPNRVNYRGTRIVEVDSYFKDTARSHKYQFEDDGFTLLSSDNLDSCLKNLKRIYHYSNKAYTLEQKECQPIEFEADSDEEAIEKFNGRAELR